MARGGSKKGERRGGREKGTLNKATLEKLAQGERQLQQARASGRKIAVEILDDLMQLGMGIAAATQPYPKTMKQNPGYDKDTFWRAADFTRQCARDLAAHQTPKLKAVVHTQVPVGVDPGKVQTASPPLLELRASNDDTATSRAYQRYIAGGE